MYLGESTISWRFIPDSREFHRPVHHDDAGGIHDLAEWSINDDVEPVGYEADAVSVPASLARIVMRIHASITYLRLGHTRCV